MYNFPSDFPDLYSEAVHARKILEVLSLARQSEQPADFWQKFLERSHDEYLSKRLNATVGIILGELIGSSTANDPIRMNRQYWRPVQPEAPSSLERIAGVYLSINPPSQSLLQLSTSDIQTLMGFALSKRKLYSSGKLVLENVLPALQLQYGQESFPFGLAVSEFIKCCNMTGSISTGEKWARTALANRLETSGVSTSPDTVYLRVALADSLLASSNYESAIGILSDILRETELAQPSILIMLIVRLCKAHRRSEDCFPSRDVAVALPRAIRALRHVSTNLRVAFVEEIKCNIDSMDVSEDQRRRWCESFGKLITTSPNSPKEQEITHLLKDFERLVNLISTKDLSCELKDVSLEDATADEAPVEEAMTQHQYKMILTPNQAQL